MSSTKRPWYPWYPKDFVSDEKVKSLSDDAELLYRRILDTLWQASALHLPSISSKIANQIARGWSAERFQSAWDEIQTPGFELLKTTEDGQFVYSKRLLDEAQHIEKISKIKSENGKKASAKHQTSISQKLAKHQPSHTDTYTDTDIKEKLDQKRKVSKSKSLIPANFSITDEMRQWFEKQNFQCITIQGATDQFVDYWRSRGEMMRDWEATWRNGMRKYEEWAKEKAPKIAPATTRKINMADYETPPIHRE